jgi:hypothetical protein
MYLFVSSANGYQYWNDIRNSALLPDSTITIKVENPAGAGVENYLLYSSGGIQEEGMTLISDGPSTLSATVPGPVTDMLYYGFRLIQGDELDIMPVRLGDAIVPGPDDLTQLAADVTGDELFGYVNLDLTDCHISFSGDRLYAVLQNAGGGFPVNQGLTFFGYLLGIANPAQADPDTVWGLMYTFEQAGIISPGLYRIEGTGFDDIVKIGEVDVQEYPATNQLMISCLISDLLADPYLLSWYDPADPEFGVAAFTQRITLLGGASEADRSPGGSCYLREFSISPGENQLPELMNADFQGTGSEAFAQIEYSDADGHCPVLSEIVFDGSLVFAMYPLTLDYDSTVTYRTDAGIGPLADDSWSTALFRFSDNLEDVVEHEVSATGIADEHGWNVVSAISVSNAPNPFNATTTISFDLTRDMHVRICVYDARGAYISTIVDEHLSEGHQEYQWRAESYKGNEIASGIYFLRFYAAGSVQTRKIVLMR